MCRPACAPETGPHTSATACCAEMPVGWPRTSPGTGEGRRDPWPPCRPVRLPSYGAVLRSIAFLGPCPLPCASPARVRRVRQGSGGVCARRRRRAARMRDAGGVDTGGGRRGERPGPCPWGEMPGAEPAAREWKKRPSKPQGSIRVARTGRGGGCGWARAERAAMRRGADGTLHDMVAATACYGHRRRRTRAWTRRTAASLCPGAGDSQGLEADIAAGPAGRPVTPVSLSDLTVPGTCRTDRWTDEAPGRRVLDQDRPRHRELCVLVHPFSYDPSSRALRFLTGRLTARRRDAVAAGRGGGGFLPRGRPCSPWPIFGAVTPTPNRPPGSASGSRRSTAIYVKPSRPCPHRSAPGRGDADDPGEGVRHPRRHPAADRPHRRRHLLPLR